MQYQIPQFIETEDKIVGPLTLKQFLYLAGFGGIALVLFFILDGVFALITAIPVIAIGGALAFVKINNVPLAQYFSSMIGFAFNTKEYTWKKGPQHPSTETAGDQQPTTSNKQSTTKELE